MFPLSWIHRPLTAADASLMRQHLGGTLHQRTQSTGVCVCVCVCVMDGWVGVRLHGQGVRLVIMWTYHCVCGSTPGCSGQTSSEDAEEPVLAHIPGTVPILPGQLSPLHYFLSVVCRSLHHVDTLRSVSSPPLHVDTFANDGSVTFRGVLVIMIYAKCSGHSV